VSATQLAQLAIALMLGMVMSTVAVAALAGWRAGRWPVRRGARGGRDVWPALVAGLATLGFFPPDVRLALAPSAMASRADWNLIVAGGASGLVIGGLLSTTLFCLGRKGILRA